MRAATLKRHIDLHAWVGILAGLALFVAFFAGALNMFHHELHHWQEPAHEAGAPDANMQALLDTVLANHPEAGNWMFLIPGDDPSAIWQEQVDGKPVWHTEHAADFNDAGENVAVAGSGLSEFVNELHYELALPKVGIHLMGIVSVLYGAALIGGLVIHWSRLRKEFFALKHQGNLRRYWKNLHNLVGVLSYPFHVIFAWTGAAMCCLALLTLVMSGLVFGPQFQSAFTDATEAWPAPQASGNAVAMAGVDRYLARAEQTLPELEVGWIELQQYGDENAVVDVGGSLHGNVGHYAHVVMRGDDAALLTTTGPGNRTLNDAFLTPVYSLHFGDYGGLLVRVLYFVLALLGCLLFFSGNILWCERRTDRQGPSRAAAVMLRLTLGVTFGVVAGLAVSFLVSKPMLHSPWSAWTAPAEKIAFLITLLIALAAAFRAPPLATARLWPTLCAVLYMAAPLVQGAWEGFATWRETDILLVNGSLWAVAAGLLLVERLRVRRQRRAAPHPLWTGTVRSAAPAPAGADPDPA